MGIWSFVRNVVAILSVLAACCECFGSDGWCSPNQPASLSEVWDNTSGTVSWISEPQLGGIEPVGMEIPEDHCVGGPDGCSDVRSNEFDRRDTPCWSRHCLNWMTSTRRTLGDDLKNFYSVENAGFLVVGFGTGAILAHTEFDRRVRDWWQADIHTPPVRDFFDRTNDFGQMEYVVGASAAAWAFYKLCPDASLTASAGSWGTRNLRSLIVGLPPMFFAQMATGASRPTDSSRTRWTSWPRGSYWAPFSDNNGVSGHAFVGAVPFINAAMMTEDPLLKTVLFAGSTLTGISRIDRDTHYTSQVVLGWWMAYLSCRAIDKTNDPSKRRFEIVPVAENCDAGFSIVLSR